MRHRSPLSGQSIELKEKRSKFIGISRPIDTEEGFKTWLSTIRKQHHSASHICWAYRIIVDQSIVENSSDAGEPSGSAGVPILNSLKRSGIINIGFAVVRYFGGTRLGKRRLMDIYGKVTEKVIKSAGLKPWIDWCQYRITGPLGSYGDISIGINKLGGKIILDNSNDQLSFQARIPRNKINNLIILIRNATQGQGELILEE